MLHIVSSSEGLSACKRCLLPDDRVLFLGEGVYALEPTECEQTLAILQDVIARGVSLQSGVKGINYDEFVRQIVSTPSSVTWK